MAKEIKGYEIIPSKINPKFGIVVNKVEKKKETEISIDPSDKRKWHEENNRQGYKSEINYVSDNKYRLTATHKFHFLHQEMHLEITNPDDQNEQSLLCSFVFAEIEQLNCFIDDDEFLLGTILCHFQMNIMHHLLRFCQDMGIKNIILYVDTDKVEMLELYEEIVVKKSLLGGLKGTKTKIIINASAEILKDWEETVKTMRHELTQALWVEQRTNIAAREYLKMNPCHELFC